MRRRRPIGTVAVTCLLFAAGCSGEEPPPKAAKPDCSWAIGTMGALTGDDSEQMIKLFRAVELAVDTARERGDLTCDIELESEDTAGDLDEARARARSLVANDRLVACVCPYRSDETIEIGSVFDAAGVVMISGGTDDAISGQALGTWFRALPKDQIQAEGTVRYISEALGPDRAGVVDDGSVSGRALADAVATGLGEVVARRASTTASSVDEIATNLAQDEVQLVYYAGGGTTAAGLARALRGAKVHAPVLIGAAEPGALPPTSELEGLDAVLVACPCVDPSAVASEFAETYTQRYEEMPGPFAAEFYEVTALVVEALKGVGAGAPIEDVRAAVLQGLRVPTGTSGVSGRLEWDGSGERIIEPLDAVWVYEYDPRQGVLAPLGPVSALI